MKFRMVDRILAWQPQQSIRGVKSVSFEEYRLKSALGDGPHLPQTLVMEALLQLGNWLIVLSSDFRQMGLVVTVHETRFLKTLRPGQSLVMEAEVRSYRADRVAFDGRGFIDRQVIAEATGCTALPVDLADYHDPDDLRILFSEIYQPEDR